MSTKHPTRTYQADCRVFDKALATLKRALRGNVDIGAVFDTTRVFEFAVSLLERNGYTLGKLASITNAHAEEIDIVATHFGRTSPWVDDSMGVTGHQLRLAATALVRMWQLELDASHSHSRMLSGDHFLGHCKRLLHPSEPDTADAPDCPEARLVVLATDGRHVYAHFQGTVIYSVATIDDERDNPYLLEASRRFARSREQAT